MKKGGVHILVLWKISAWPGKSFYQLSPLPSKPACLDSGLMSSLINHSKLFPSWGPKWGTGEKVVIMVEEGENGIVQRKRMSLPECNLNRDYIYYLFGKIFRLRLLQGNPNLLIIIHLIHLNR